MNVKHDGYSISVIHTAKVGVMHPLPGARSDLIHPFMLNPTATR